MYSIKTLLIGIALLSLAFVMGMEVFEFNLQMIPPAPNDGPDPPPDGPINSGILLGLAAGALAGYKKLTKK